jgi:hypothetical protein
VTGRGLRAVLAAAAPLLAIGDSSDAQTVGAIDAGVSAVEYEGYLASGAVFVNPFLRHDTPRLSLAAQGSWIVFESGNHILQGTAAGGWRSPPLGGWRAELSGSGGVSSYVVSDTAFPTYGHVLGRIRLHFGGRRSGAWAGAASGHSFFGDTTGTPVEIGAGVWTARDRFVIGGTVTGTWLEDSSYVDLTGSLRWRFDWFELYGTAGLRTASEGGGSGVWAEASLEVPLAAPLTVLIAGGRYPSDPVRGVLAASYVSAGIRLTPFRSATRLDDALGTAYRQALDDRAPARALEAAVLALGDASAAGREILVTVAGAMRVELTGDFTDWQPRAMVRVDEDTWAVRLALPAGIHRLNLRVDGGGWIVPAGLTSIEDEYGGRVGLLVIP